MDKILILGDSNGTLDIIQCAHEMGLYVIVTDYYSPEKSRAKLIADEYWMISTGDLIELEKECRKSDIKAVTSGVSDFNIEMSIKLCMRLNLPLYCDLDVWYAIKNKSNFKKVCEKNGVPVPKSYHYPLNGKREQVQFPVVVKPVDKESNVGINFCNNNQELEQACEQARLLSDCGEYLVEQQIIGTEFFVYYVIAEARAHFLNIGIRLSQPGMPKFCYSMNISSNSFLDEYMSDIDGSMKKMLADIGCTDGIVCVQCMRDEKGSFYAFEMCYSLEGSMLIKPYKYINGFDYNLWFLQIALGRRHTIEYFPNCSNKREGYAGSYILFSNKSGVINEISGFDKLENLSGIDFHLHKIVGDRVNMYQALGNIMFYSKDMLQIVKILHFINDSIKIKDENGDNMLIYYEDYKRIEDEYYYSE